jgi:hypothetical protein
MRDLREGEAGNRRALLAQAGIEGQGQTENGNS